MKNKKYAYLISFDYEEVYGKPQYIILNNSKKAKEKLKELALKEYKKEIKNRYGYYITFEEYLEYNYWGITKVEYE